MAKTITLVFLCLQLLATSSEEILILQPFCPKSHKVVVDPIAETLGSKGHHVTYLSPFSYEGSAPANVTEIVYHQYKPYFATFQDIWRDVIRSGWTPKILTRYFQLHSKLCQQLYDSGLLQKWTNNKKKFRVVLIDSVFTECILPLWRNFGDSVIILNSSPLNPMIVKMLNLPTPYSHVPYIIHPYTHRMSFSQRFVNTLYWISSSYVAELSQAMFYKHVILPNFPDTKPSSELLTNISLVLVNEDPVFFYPRPYLPTVIRIGGIQCRPAVPLPESNLKKFIEDSGDDGFILVSFGSIINGEFIGENLISALKTAFAHIKQRVIWKYESEITGLSNNVRTVKWFPQGDILGHPKIRVFINQGGLNSVQESLYNQVPQICFPMASDQPLHAVAVSNLGIGIQLDYTTVTAEEIVSSINKASNDPEMRKMVEYYSKVFRDTPEPPVQTAVYWIEYVMKFNGALHLQSAAGDLNSIQYYLLDVYGLILLIMLLVGTLLWFSIKKTVKYFLLI
uniref:UDP-glycosyltransferase 212A3 n=1 Tax=Strigamia maritima TaxID=126957 RepID=A0A023R7P7_STRMM|nr:UDP-glycosyltransferase 212A3 [Strigamia maritima]